MKIYLVRHGETDLNKQNRMQSISDEPLNEKGIAQAQAAKQKIGDMHFDAVYSSSLIRAITTASIIGGVDKSEIIIDDRIIEADFGKYEKKKYYLIGLPMILHWCLPEVFPPRKTVETVDHIKARANSFLEDLKTKDYDSVLIVCHGNFIRFFKHILLKDSKQATWKDFVENCELQKFEI